MTDTIAADTERTGDVGVDAPTMKEHIDLNIIDFVLPFPPERTEDAGNEVLSMARQRALQRDFQRALQRELETEITAMNSRIDNLYAVIRGVAIRMQEMNKMLAHRMSEARSIDESLAQVRRYDTSDAAPPSELVSYTTKEVIPNPPKEPTGREYPWPVPLLGRFGMTKEFWLGYRANPLKRWTSGQWTLVFSLFAIYFAGAFAVVTQGRNVEMHSLGYIDIVMVIGCMFAGCMMLFRSIVEPK